MGDPGSASSGAGTGGAEGGGSGALSGLGTGSDNGGDEHTPLRAHGRSTGDGRVLVRVGHHGSCSASAEIYNPRLGTWSPTAAMSTGPLYHTATLLPDGQVLVTGG